MTAPKPPSRSDRADFDARMIAADFSATRSPEIMFRSDNLHLVREWFDAVLDTNAAYLRREDFDLAEQIYAALGMRWPSRCRELQLAARLRSSQ